VIQTLEFAEWLPDLPEFTNPGSLVVKNVIPSAKGFLPVRSLSAVSDALNERCRGGIGVRSGNGNNYQFVGDAEALYSYSNNTHTNITIPSTPEDVEWAATAVQWASQTLTWGGIGAYSATSSFWSFAKFGEKVIATNGVDTPQIITLGGANFGDLPGNPPIGRFVGIVREFVVFAHTTEGGTTYPQRVNWSAINNEQSYTSNPATQSDFQDLFSSAQSGGGRINGFLGGQFGLIFMERSIFRMTYEGPPVVFRFDELQPGLGCAARNSITRHGNIAWFLSQDGFYEIMAGEQFQAIGKNKVDEFFYRDLNTQYIDNVVGAYDVSNKMVMWAYPSQESADGQPDRIIMYDYVNKRWSIVHESAQWIISGVGSSTTLDGLDAVATALAGTSSIDALTTSLDSDSYLGSAFQLWFYDADSKRATRGGPTLPATMQTGGAQIKLDQRAMITGVRPLIQSDNGAVTAKAQINYRNSIGSPLQQTGQVGVNAQTGLAPFRLDARYHRLTVHTEGDFDHAIGADVEYYTTGRK